MVIRPHDQRQDGLLMGIEGVSEEDGKLAMDVSLPDDGNGVTKWSIGTTSH